MDPAKISIGGSLTGAGGGAGAGEAEYFSLLRCNQKIHYLRHFRFAVHVLVDILPGRQKSDDFFDSQRHHPLAHRYGRSQARTGPQGRVTPV